MANRSCDRIRNYESKHDPAGFFPFSDESRKQPEVIVELTGDYPDDYFDETTCNDLNSD